MPFLLAALLGPAMLGLTLWKRSAGLALFMALLPTYVLRFEVPLPGAALPTTVLEVLFWMLFVGWVVTDGRKPGAWRGLADWLYPVILWMTAATVSVLVSPDLRAALGLWRAYFLEPLLFLPLFVDVNVRERRGWWVLGGLAASVVFVGLSAMYQKFTGAGIPNPIWAAPLTRRVTSVYGFPNAVALFCAPLTVLFAGWSLALWGRPFVATEAPRPFAHKLRAFGPLAAAALGLAATALAVSKGGLLAIGIGLLVLGLLHTRLRLLALLAVTAVTVAVLFSAPAKDFLANTLAARDDSSSVRVIIWRETAQLLRDSPVFGAGLSGYPGRIVDYHAAYWIEVFQYPHNIVLNFWSETGLLGLLAFAWLCVRFFRRAGRMLDAGEGGWIVPAATAAMAALLVHGLVDVPYFKNDLAFLFWAVVGAAEAARQALIARDTEPPVRENASL